MIRKDKVKFKDGTTKTQVRVVKSFRPGPGQSPKQTTLKSFGYLEDHEDQTAFLDEVKRFDEAQKLNTKKKQLMISVPLNRKNNDVLNRKYNYGYRFLESIYDFLGIREFFEKQSFRGQYALSEVFEFLTLKRIMNPNSKRGTLQEIKQFYNKHYGFSLTDIYRALDKFSDLSVQLQNHLNDRIKKTIGRDASYAFYDVTNYYFETDFPEEAGKYQQKGVSKEHRLSPIIQLGLFMDSNNLPIAMSTFPGNTSDTKTLQPAMEDIKKNYGLGRLIVVADKGLNSKANLDYIVNQGDGYVVSQTLKGNAGKKYQDMMMDENDYVGNANFKYKLFHEDYDATPARSKKRVIRRRKVLIYWSKEDSDFAKKKRSEKVSRAKKRMMNNAYGINHTAGEYVTTSNIVDSTGEVSDKSVHTIDYDKINEDEKFDGYFCIITSELDYDHKKIMEVYGSLWRIEESFRITKSDLQTRPIYVRTQKHIEGHMLICYTALLILRLLQYKLGHPSLSASRIKRALNACTCTLPNDQAVLLDEIGGALGFKERPTTEKERERSGKETAETLTYDKDKDQIRSDYKAIQEAFGVSFDYAASTREDFNKYLKLIKYKIKKP